MAELNLALSALSQFLAHLFDSDLSLQTLLAIHMLTWQPFRVFYVDRLADRTLELTVHQLEVVR